MGEWDDISRAPVSQGGNYFPAGHRYLVEVAVTKMNNSRKGDRQFILEGRVHDSSSPAMPIGGMGSWIVSMKHDSAKGDILKFVGTLKGIAVSDERALRTQVTPQDVEHMLDTTRQPYRGTMLELTTQEVPTRAGGKFTKHAWTLTQRRNPNLPALPPYQPQAAPAPGGWGPPAGAPAPGGWGGPAGAPAGAPAPGGWGAPAGPPAGAGQAPWGGAAPVAPPLAPAPQWVAHPNYPGWQLNPATGEVRQAQ